MTTGVVYDEGIPMSETITELVLENNNNAMARLTEVRIKHFKAPVSAFIASLDSWCVDPVLGCKEEGHLSVCQLLKICSRSEKDMVIEW